MCQRKVDSNRAEAFQLTWERSWDFRLVAKVLPTTRSTRGSKQSKRMPSMFELGGFCKIPIRNSCSRGVPSVKLCKAGTAVSVNYLVRNELAESSTTRLVTVIVRVTSP